MNAPTRRRPILTLNWPRNLTPKSGADELHTTTSATDNAAAPTTPDRGASVLADGPTLTPAFDEVFADLRALRKRFKGMRRPQPLKIGIAADLIAETGWPKDRVGRALGIHTNATGYLKATIEGAPRVDLNGAPVGIVSEDQAAHAESVLRAREKRKGQA